MAPVLSVLIGLALVFLLLAVHPYVTYPLSLMAMPRREVRLPQGDWVRPKIAVCMSAYNEETVIVAKIQSLLTMVDYYGPAQIHVYLDGSTDRTAELLEAYRDRIDLVVSSERRGKTAGMKELVARTDASILAFTDANVEVPAHGLLFLAAQLQDPEVCCASARLNYSNRSETGMSAASTLYWNIEEFIKALETETVSLIGVDGALFVIERSAYFPPPSELIDDLYVSMKALMTGKRVVSAPLVTVQERNATRWTEEFVRKVRIACQAMRVHRALWADIRHARPIIIYCYLSHRVTKWMSPFSLLFSGMFFLAALATVIGTLPALGLAFGAAAVLLLGALFNLPYFRLVLTALVSLAGVACGQLQAFLTPNTYATWTPADSVRRRGG
jgi:cellulose synthase/poly-beta-1,6-N-acetylglucosamine synthase-like glycosyltransferase